MLRFDRLVVSCVDHRHSGSAPEDLGQQAVAVWRQVGDDHKGHAVLGRRGSKKSLQRLYPARRGTDAHDRKMRRHSSDSRIVTSASINAEGPGYNWFSASREDAADKFDDSRTLEWTSPGRSLQ